MDGRDGPSAARLWCAVVVLSVLFGVAVAHGAELLLHRGDPVVWGSFVQTTEPCRGKGCQIVGDWVADGSNAVHHGTYLLGDIDGDGRARAAYHGPLPIPSDPPPDVMTAGDMRADLWVDIAAIVLFGALLYAPAHMLYRRHQGHPRRGRRPRAPDTGPIRHR